MTVVSEAVENPTQLLSIIPAIVFETRINLPKNKFILDYINPGAVGLLGLDVSTFDSTTFSLEDFLRLVHPDDLKELDDRFRARAKGFSQYHVQCRLLLPDIGVRWLDIVADPEAQPDDWVIWRGVATDVTAIKQVEEEFRRGQERFELAAQAGGIGVWDMDIETQICVWDARMYELYGVDPESFDCSMIAWCALLNLEDTERTVKELDAILTSGAMLDYEFQIDGPNGAPRHIRALARMVRGADGVFRRAVGINLDVTERWELQCKLEHMAAHDALTGLPNRLTFERKLQEACDQAHGEGRQHALCFMDLDRFKIVNDSAGHAAGDAFLRHVGNLIQSTTPGQDFTARLGGDEFALLLYDCSTAKAEHMARELIDAIRAIRLVWEDKIYDIGASLGLTAITAKSPGPAELMSQADVACYAAKASGRNQVLVYGGRNGAAERHHREILVASGIRRAIEAGQLELFAQEIITLTSGKTGIAAGKGRNVEVLLRMKDASGRVLRPGSFIPAAERYDLMGNLDRWVLENVLVARGEALAAIDDLSISINLSANSLNDPLFWPFLDETLKACRLPPGRINFEITETAMINNLDSARNFMSVVRAAGHALVLDDFGTGLSSFNYLKQFPVDGLKIDGSFIRQLKDSPVDRVIVESINEIAHRLGIKTVAEFVEDAETLEIVRAIGIDQAQGYAIGRPVSLDAMIEDQAAPLLSLGV